MHFIKTIFILILLLNGMVPMAQLTGFAAWTSHSQVFKINRLFGIALDEQLRSNEQVKRLNGITLRSAINITIKKDFIATVGYGWIANRRTIGEVTGLSPEHRIWEQLQLRHPLFFTLLTHRLRLEQRFMSKYFVENNELRNQGNSFANRLRYQFRDILPFNGKKNFDKGLFTALQNEIFINVGNKSSVNGKYFDQNRLLLGLGYRFSKKFDLEAGYMNRYLSGINKSFINDHIAQVATYLRL